jgi:hypothetical protein
MLTIDSAAIYERNRKQERDKGIRGQSEAKQSKNQRERRGKEEKVKMKMEMPMQIRRPGALSDESFGPKTAHAERE